MRDPWLPHTQNGLLILDETETLNPEAATDLAARVLEAWYDSTYADSSQKPKH